METPNVDNLRGSFSGQYTFELKAASMFQKANNLIGTNCNGLATRLATVVKLPHPLFINREAKQYFVVSHTHQVNL